MHKILKYILLSLMMILQINLCCFAKDNNSDLQTLVENFCSKEFHGLGGFQDIVDGDENAEPIPLFRCTSKMPKQIKEDVCDNMESYLSWEPLFITDAYKVEKIKQLDSQHAYAIVTYHQLARSEGHGDGPVNSGESIRTFIKDVRNITVKLNLEYDGKRWWIVDPSYPKVSYDVILKYYQDKAASIFPYAIGEKGPPLRRNKPKELYRLQQVYDYQKSVVDFLINLKK